MELNTITGIVIEESIRLHREIGPGLIESVYEAVLADRLAARGLKVQRQLVVPIVIDGKKYGEGFRLDLLVEDLVIVESRSVQELPPVAFKKMVTYLWLMDLRVGLLINFREETLVQGLHRIVNNYVAPK